MEHKIFQKIEQSSKPNFSDVISKSFDMFKLVFKEGLIHSLISLAIAIPFLLIIYIPVLPAYIDMIQHAGEYGYQPTFFKDMSPVLIVVWVLFVFVFSFLLQVVNVSVLGHFLKLVKNKDLGTNDTIGGYFSIAKEHFGKILLLSLATMGIAILATMLCYFPIIYAMVPLTIITPIFVFNPEMSVGDLVKASFKLGNKYWGVLFGIIFIASLIATLGMIACYIGFVATMAYNYVAYYYIYKDTIGFDEEPSTSGNLLV